MEMSSSSEPLWGNGLAFAMSASNKAAEGFSRYPGFSRLSLQAYPHCSKHGGLKRHVFI